MMFNINKFLDDNGFNLDINHLFEVNKFLKQMDDKLAGEESSLGMLNSYIRVGSEFSRDKKITVIDAGGTNLRISNLYFNKSDKLVIDSFNKTVMPGVNNEVSKDEFYTYIGNEVLKSGNYSNSVGFCFSYPVDLIDSTDGVILRMCKEIKAPDVVGSRVCLELQEAIKRAGGGDKNFTLLNDSTATLLAGFAKDKERSYGGYIGLILGTGSNSCYINDGYIYNLESGWYDGVPRGRFDEILDRNSINPGKYFMEKATSGAYLGPLTSIILKDLVEKGVISDSGEYTTREINEFIKGDITLCQKEDQEIFESVIERVIKRSALYVSINLASLLIKTNSRLKPVLIIPDGSTFQNLHNYKKEVEKNIKLILGDDYPFELEYIDDAPLVGGAISALMN